MREFLQVYELQTKSHTLNVSLEALTKMKALSMQAAYAKHLGDTEKQTQSTDGVVFCDLKGGTYRLQLFYPNIGSDQYIKDRAGNVTAMLVQGVYGVRLPDGFDRFAMNVGDRIARRGSEATITEPYSKICTVCNAPAKSKCNGCLSVRYCGKVCQQSHWKEHKAVCAMITYSPSTSSGM